MALRWEGNFLMIDGQIGSYSVDVQNFEIRMLPNQRLPLARFALLKPTARKSAAKAASLQQDTTRLLTAITMLANDATIESPEIKRLIAGEA